jgi:hypothetical protein
MVLYGLYRKERIEIIPDKEERPSRPRASVRSAGHRWVDRSRKQADRTEPDNIVGRYVQ